MCLVGAVPITRADEVGQGDCFSGGTNLKEYYEKQIDDCSKVLKLNPKDEDTYVKRGFAYGGLKQYQNGIDDCCKALALNPRFERAYSIRGYIYEQLKEYQKAQDDYAKALTLNPNFEECSSVRK